MNASRTQFLSEINAGIGGPTIPASTRAYFQQRLRNRVLAFLLKKFQSAQKSGLTKAELARRIGKTPDVINRWLGAPSNLTIDTISDMLLGISGEEMIVHASSVEQPKHNYSHYWELVASSTDGLSIKDRMVQTGTKAIRIDTAER